MFFRFCCIIQMFFFLVFFGTPALASDADGATMGATTWIPAYAVFFLGVALGLVLSLRIIYREEV